MPILGVPPNPRGYFPWIWSISGVPSLQILCTFFGFDTELSNKNGENWPVPPFFFKPPPQRGQKSKWAKLHLIIYCLNTPDLGEFPYNTQIYGYNPYSGVEIDLYFGGILGETPKSAKSGGNLSIIPNSGVWPDLARFGRFSQIWPNLDNSDKS